MTDCNHRILRFSQTCLFCGISAKEILLALTTEFHAAEQREEREALARTPDKSQRGDALWISHPDDFHRWSAAQQLIHDRKIAQAKAALDRPQRFGPMGNRDRYGQLIGGGWDSADVDDL